MLIKVIKEKIPKVITDYKLKLKNRNNKLKVTYLKPL